mmetsp:Transcript_10026/g.20480  ORF Transcript_10026/g.20480 Transcript_10026/m.20480 type:complete len:295 (+) Transcript_10026:3-887(+)
MFRLLSILAVASAYKPVLVLHGISGDAAQYTDFVNDLVNDHPGTIATALPVFEDIPGSLPNLNYQVRKIASHITSMVDSDPATYSSGYHLVCHSQGALICRCLTEYMSSHNISKLVSMAGPQMGVYDEAFFEFFGEKIGEVALEEIYKLAYTGVFQDSLSVANMWSDPYHVDEYLESNAFLPIYNGLVEHDRKDEFKDNFLSLDKAVFVVGSQAEGVTFDGGIGPWSSGVFSYYNSTGSIIPMSLQDVYVHDTFGLRSMDVRGDLVVDVVEGVEHNEWFNNQDVYREHVFVHLD